MTENVAPRRYKRKEFSPLKIMPVLVIQIGLFSISQVLIQRLCDVSNKRVDAYDERKEEARE